MTNLDSSSRLKVKNDTFYLPDPSGGVYFRNNSSSFRMEGGTIYQWIEKLIPMFNGEHTLEELTAGLSTPYRNRVYEIGKALYENGYVRDASRDHSHHLKANVLEKYASQIEFIENFVDSGAFRFQTYRQAKVLAIGSGPLFVSLITALMESGHPKFQMMVTDSVPTNRLRIEELVNHAKKDDSDVDVEEIPIGKGKNFWRDTVQPYDCILYVSQNGDVNVLKELNQVCKEEQKTFIPALYLDHVGFAGPLVHPESEGCWESAWRRIHQTSLEHTRERQAYSSTAGAMLANIIVFELFKKITGTIGTDESNQFYLLDLETLKGDWISYYAHPLVQNIPFSPRLVEELTPEQEQNSTNKLLEYFSLLTAEETGILHTWDEGNLKQLPLSQCYVQAVNPLSDGPTDLLEEVLCSGLTHEEARKEAGLTGIEMYVSQMIKGKLEGVTGIGAGENIAEAVCRGLQSLLEQELKNSKKEERNKMFRVHVETIEDPHCRYYLQSLTTLHGEPTIGLENEIVGFPVICLETQGRRYSSIGLTITLALRNALQKALMDTQNEGITSTETASFIKQKEGQLEIPSCAEITQTELLQSAIQILNGHHKKLVVYDLSFEPFLKKELAGVFGVQIREEAR